MSDATSNKMMRLTDDQVHDEYDSTRRYIDSLKRGAVALPGSMNRAQAEEWLRELGQELELRLMEGNE